jgi:hypothetical protein
MPRALRRPEPHCNVNHDGDNENTSDIDLMIPEVCASA